MRFILMEFLGLGSLIKRIELTVGKRLVNFLIWLLVVAFFLWVAQFIFEGAKWVYSELKLFGIWTWLHNEEIRTLALSVLCILVPVFAGMDYFRSREMKFRSLEMRKTIEFLAAHIPDEYKNAELLQAEEFQKSRGFRTNPFKFFIRMVMVIVCLVLFVFGTVGLIIYSGVFAAPT